MAAQAKQGNGAGFLRHDAVQGVAGVHGKVVGYDSTIPQWLGGVRIRSVWRVAKNTHLRTAASAQIMS